MELSDGMVKESVAEILYESVARDALLGVLPIIAADYTTGQIVYANELADQMFGYPYKELIGQLVEVLVPDNLKQRHQEHRTHVTPGRARAMGFGGMLRGRRKDGTVFPAHIGLIEAQVDGQRVGIAIIFDMSWYGMENPEPLDRGTRG